jgi:mono/diheme cytochrome c family protein
MRQPIEHLEVYLDQVSQPLHKLSTPPFRVQLDTHSLSNGFHELRLVTIFKDGREEQQTISFMVNNLAATAIEGLQEGETVRGTLDLHFKPGGYDNPSEGIRTSPWLYVVTPLVLLIGVWALFVLTTPFGDSLGAKTAKSSSAAKQSPMLPAPVDHALWNKGRNIYAKSCGACHQASGEGVPHVFPPLAGNASLGDTGFVIETIYRGKSGTAKVNGETFSGTMAAVGAKFSDTELASVASYIRNNWGNTFGGVTEKQVSQILFSGSTQVGGR